MDVENIVRLKVFVPDMETFVDHTKLEPVKIESSCNLSSCEFVCDGRSYQVNVQFCTQKDGMSFAFLFLKNAVELSSKKYIAECLTETDLKNFCKYLSELYSGEVYLEHCREAYGNFNVFNGGSDYDVIEEKWITCVYNKGVLVEEKSFTK